MAKGKKQSSERGSYAGGVARREAILDATVEMIAEVGYHGMSMRDIARRVGISHPGVIYHFPSKEALMMAVIDRYEELSHFDLHAMAAMPPFAVFEAFMKLSTELSKSATIVEMECMLAVEASNEVHPAHDHFVARFNELHSLLTKAYKQLKEDGLLLQEVSPSELGYSLLGQWYGLQIQWLYNREAVDIEANLTASIIREVDLSKPETLKGIMASGFASPATISAIEEVSGMTLEDLMEQGYINLSSADMEKYGLSEVPQTILEKVMRSGAITAKDLEYSHQQKGFSIDLLGRLVVNNVLEEEEYNVLADLGIVPKEAIAALRAVMAARVI